MYLPGLMDSHTDREHAAGRRAIVTLTHAIVNDETTFLPGLSSRSTSTPSSTTTSVSATTTASKESSGVPPRPTSSTPEETLTSPRTDPTSAETTRTGAESRLPSLAPSITFNTTSPTTITVSTSTAISAAEPTTISLSSIEASIETTSKLSATSAIETSSTSIREASSTSLSPITEISSATSTLPLERPTSAQDKETVETSARPVAVTTPPPNNRGTAVGIAFGAFAGFSVAIICAVLFYKMRRKSKPKSGIKQFQ